MGPHTPYSVPFKIAAWLCLALLGCREEQQAVAPEASLFLVVLGVAQDGGYPQAGCRQACCRAVWEGRIRSGKVVSLGLVDREHSKVYLFDATPDFREQLHTLLDFLPPEERHPGNLAGIFLTHAHTGHYTGLIHLGREAMNTHQVPVYALPRMRQFLQNNGPWSQLVRLQNIDLRPMQADSATRLTSRLSIRPFTVPHRDEYSETAGFLIRAGGRQVLFIPDIDKWNQWENDIVRLVATSDYALLDATFYDGDELPHRNMDEIPHPFVVETMRLFAPAPDSLKNRIRFIHFNHTNPLLRESAATASVRQAGYHPAREGDIFALIP